MELNCNSRQAQRQRNGKMKKLPKTLQNELKHHDFPTRFWAIADYRQGKRTAHQLVRDLSQKRSKGSKEQS